MIVLNGFVKIHRKLLQWGWYQDSIVKDTFLHLIFAANFKDYQWMGTVIERGQVIVSYNQLSHDLGFSVQQIRTAIEKLKSTGEITSKSTNKYTIVTVVNYDDYQCNDEEVTSTTTRTITSNSTNEQQALCVTGVLQSDSTIEFSTNKSTIKNLTKSLSSQGFTEEQIKIITSNLTNKQQASNKPATNEQQQRKKVKNDKNDKNSIKHAHGEFKNVLLTDDELSKLVERFIDVADRIERLSLYIMSKGAKYSSHYATILSWARKEPVIVKSSEMEMI